MKNAIERAIMILEMATICNEEGYKITVYPEPLDNPSFHLIYKRDWEVVLQIKDFKILEVKRGSFEKNKLLPRNILNDLIEILENDDEIISNWNFLLKTWNANNPKYKISTLQSIPII